jgi:alpha-D-ribose 1-methylphosphonate 5-triphosphate diphosphatase
MTEEQIFTNARIVLPDAVLMGTVVIRDGRIEDIAEGPSALGAAEDLEGDLLVPGLVELHTDNLEKHVRPRPGVVWKPFPALLSHDATLAGAGITTALDALRLGDRDAEPVKSDIAMATAENIRRVQGEGLLKTEHFIHFRCEVSAANVMEKFDSIGDHELLRLVSLMDHTPGQRQFADIPHWKKYYGEKLSMNEAELDDLLAGFEKGQAAYSEKHRRALADRCKARGVKLATHDDATEAHIEEAVGFGIDIAEFPTTKDAATIGKARGMRTVMGAPNVVRGGSHAGNLSAGDLAAEGLVDALSSDYMPVSLMHSAFILAERDEFDLPSAVRVVSANPAAMAGLDDRGEIVTGKRADLVQVHDGFEAPVIRRVWREGMRVA